MSNDGFEEIDETTDGPDVIRARRAVQEARQATRQTDKIVTETQSAIATLRRMHEENHFADKLRLVIRGM